MDAVQSEEASAKGQSQSIYRTISRRAINLEHIGTEFSSLSIFDITVIRFSTI